LLWCFKIKVQNSKKKKRNCLIQCDLIGKSCSGSDVSLAPCVTAADNTRIIIQLRRLKIYGSSYRGKKYSGTALQTSAAE